MDQFHHRKKKLGCLIVSGELSTAEQVCLTTVLKGNIHGEYSLSTRGTEQELTEMQAPSISSLGVLERRQ